MPVKRIGVDDPYGQTGTADELLGLYGLSFDQIATNITEFINKMPQYHQEDKNGTNNQADQTKYHQGTTPYAADSLSRVAVGAFNIDNQETLIAVARALNDSPVLVEVSDGEVRAMGLGMFAIWLITTGRYGIEMFLNLDHSPSVEAAKKAIDAGYEFIHIDISQAIRPQPTKRSYRRPRRSLTMLRLRER